MGKERVFVQVSLNLVHFNQPKAQEPSEDLTKATPTTANSFNMSEKQNYDKILLASGIVLGLGVATYGTLTFLGLNDKYKFTTQVSEKAIEPPPGIRESQK